jgi:hypothetical protein
MRQIENAALTTGDVPSRDADWDTISQFALTFDGYGCWGSFDKCAEIANARSHESLTELRTCLFFEQRRWRHFGQGPDADEMKYVRELIDKILDSVSKQTDGKRVFEILRETKKLAQEYRHLTGKPLGITGEVAEYECARLLGVTLTPARQEGYDAIETQDGVQRQLQIKGRCILRKGTTGQPLGSINITKQWDAVLMVLLDRNFDAVEIYQAEREAIVAALSLPGSKARNERGAMAVSKFKSIGKLRWRRPTEAAIVREWSEGME